MISSGLQSYDGVLWTICSVKTYKLSKISYTYFNRASNYEVIGVMMNMKTPVHGYLGIHEAITKKSDPDADLVAVYFPEC